MVFNVLFPCLIAMLLQFTWFGALNSATVVDLIHRRKHPQKIIDPVKSKNTNRLIKISQITMSFKSIKRCKSKINKLGLNERPTIAKKMVGSRGQITQV